MDEKVLFYTGILFGIFAVINLLSFYSNDERYVSNDPEKKQFGHKPRMMFISKLTCGQVTARLWTDSYGPFDCRDIFNFILNALGRSKYANRIVYNDSCLAAD